MNVIVINAGSSSLKYQLLNVETREVYAKGNCERIAIEGSFIGHEEMGSPKKRTVVELEVDEIGLDSLDRRYLRALIEHYGGGPAGVETIAYAIAEARDAVEDVIEPYLMQQGFIQRTPRGRIACAKAYLHLGLSAPPQPAAPAGVQPGLFEDE